MKPTFAPALALALALAGCTTAPLSPDRAAARSDCQSQTDQALLTRNRALLFQGGPTNTPYSAGGLVGLPNQGLALRYQREQMIGDCLKNKSFGAAPAISP